MFLCDTMLILVGHPPFLLTPAPSQYSFTLLFFTPANAHCEPSSFISLHSLSNPSCVGGYPFVYVRAKTSKSLAFFKREQEVRTGCSSFCLAETWHAELGTRQLAYSTYYEVWE